MMCAGTIRTAAALALLTACVTGAAAAAERTRIVIAAVRDDSGDRVAPQLTRAICATVQCVPAGRVRTGGRLDFAAVRREGVAGVLAATVSRRSVAIALLRDSTSPERTWTLPLDASGRLPGEALARFRQELLREVSGAAPVRSAQAPSAEPAAAPPDPERTARPPPRELPPGPPGGGAPARPAEAPSRETAPAPEKARAAGARPDPVGAGATQTRAATPLRRIPSPAAAPPRSAPAPAPERAAPSLGSVDLGVHVTGRELDYQGVGPSSSALRDFRATGIVSPAVRLELYPLARVTERWPAGLAVFAAVGRSVGLETEAAGARHATTFTQVEVGAGWQVRPRAASRATLRPRISWRSLALEAGSVAGLPDAELSGPSVGVDLELPLRGRYAVLASAAYTRWTTAADLVRGSPAFFPRGGAWAADAAAGLEVGVRGPFALRATLEYGRTRYDLEGAGAYAATSATDTYLGGRAMMRLRF